MPQPVLVHVLGRDVVVERPWGSAPRVLVDGAELPRDRFGRYRLAAPDGERVVTTSFDWRGLLPVLEVGDERVPLDRPLPRGAWLLLAPLVLLSLAGGGVGAGLGIGAAWAAARQFRRAPTPARGWAGALCAVAAGVLLYAAVVALIRAVF